jgi:hypothetical protein
VSQPFLPSPGAPTIEVGPSPGVSVALVTVLCFVVVAFTSPFNLTLLLASCSLVEFCFGGYVADNSVGLVILLAALIQTALFALLWLPVYLMTRKRSLAVRVWSVIALGLVYLGLWVGWTVWLAAEMTRTNGWP